MVPNPSARIDRDCYRPVTRAAANAATMATMPPRFRLAVLATIAIAALAGSTACRKKPAAGTVRVAAAADLARAFDQVGRAFTASTGRPVVFSFSSSGLLAKQIGEGAPFDVFAAASKSYVDQVVDNQACDGATRAMYGRGRIVVWSKTSGLTALSDLAKVAIAHPDHAPYGKAAKQALIKAGLWDAVVGKLVFAENIQVTMQWAQDGSADAAIVALSLATVTTGGTSIAIAPELYDPLDQELVVCGHGPGVDGGRAFATFVASPAGRAIMNNYGFRLPGP
jgi:molybdate transport system substrate-binding protein